MLGEQQQSEPLGNAITDRRRNDRFPITSEVRYEQTAKQWRKEGVGSTINVSSSGALFMASEPLVPGKRIKVSISWPARLDGRIGLRLVASGWITRCEGKNVAVEFTKHEFRTAKTSGTSSQLPHGLI